MIDWERRVLLKHYLEQGEPIARLAKRLRIGRRTIHRLIAAGQLERDLDAGRVEYKPRPPVVHKLDAYKPVIEERLRQYPQLSSVRLMEEIRAAGYTGGYTQVKEFVRAVRPREAVEPVVRFETKPGVQGQVDFAEFQFPWGKRYALVVVMGYSRQLWLRFYERQDMATLFRGLEEAFAFFGGVPAERFERDERAVLRPLASQPYRSLVVVARAKKAQRQPVPSAAPPTHEVERRPLGVYDQLAGAA